ncbi:MAG: HAD family hydrolase, partial [Calditrichaeota bacterium]
DQVDAAYKHARKIFDAYWKKQIAFDATLGINTMLDFLELDIPVDVRKKLILYFEEIVNEILIRLVPGANALIHDLHKKYKIGLISDTAWTPGRVLEQHLQRHGVRDCFDSLVFSDQIGQCKPAKALFEKAMADLKSSPETMLHVGDLKFTDIRGANQVGCYAAWIHRPDFLENNNSHDEPHVTIGSVVELREILV